MEFPAVTTSQIQMEGFIAELVAAQQTSTQTILEVDQELEWLCAALGQQEPRDGIQMAVQRLAAQVQGLEGRGGTTTLEPGQENEFSTVVALQQRMNDDVAELSAMQRCIAESVFEVYQEIARLNLRLGKQDGVATVVQSNFAVQQAAPQVIQYSAPAPYQPQQTVQVVQYQHPQPVQSAGEMRSVSWAPGATFVQQATPLTSTTYVAAPAATQTLPAASSTYAAAAPVPVPTQAVPAQNLPTYGPPTTVVAPAQYMLPSTVSTQPAEPQQVQPALPALPALAPTTIVAPAQYMTGPAQATPVTTPAYPAAVATPVATGSGIPVATRTLAAGATLGSYFRVPGKSGSVAVPGGASVVQPVSSMVLSGGGVGIDALPLRGSLLKAGSITDDVFNMVDRNNDGVISRSEFRGALKGNVISATTNTRLQLQGHA